MENIVSEVSHRPWPLPEGRWVTEQQWHDLLFAHWRVDEGLLRQHVPGGLEIDTYEGQAWLGVVPFRMGCEVEIRAADPWDVELP